MGGQKKLRKDKGQKAIFLRDKECVMFLEKKRRKLWVTPLKK